MTVTFCGHGSVCYDLEIQEKMYKIIDELIMQGADEFLLGGYGEFDLLAARCVKRLKSRYSNMQSILVIPYMNRDYDKKLYDCSEYPPIENVPKRFAILKRNEWMVSRTDVVVAYIKYDWGGAIRTFEYAKRKNKRIINLYEGN